MKVIHIFNSSGLNGPEMLVLPALKNATWNTEIWSLHETRHGKHSVFENYCNSLCLPVRRIEVGSKLDWSAIKHMRSLVEALNSDTIFHSHDAKASVYTWLMLILKDKRNFPTVITHHGAMARPDIKSRLYEQIMTLGSRKFADTVLCVCESDFENLLLRGVPLHKLKIHKNGVNRPVLKWHQRRAYQPHTELRFAILGRLSPEKNHKRMLDVLRKMVIAHPLRWTVDIIGEGPLKSHLQKYCREIRLQDSVQFLGYQSEAWRDLDKYDCLLNFSHGEGIPISLIEAGWRSTPVFASAVGGIPELCGTDGAELFNLNDSDNHIARQLFRFTLDEIKRKEAARCLLNRIICHFSQERWLAQLEEFYHELISVHK